MKKGVDPVEDFRTKYWAWWSLVQPDFRLRDDEDELLV